MRAGDLPRAAGDVLVAGEWRRGGGPVLDCVDPASGSVVAAASSADVHDVDVAAEGAALAAADQDWTAMLPHQRARLLARIADLIERDAERLASLQTANTGKTLAETRALVVSAAGTFRFTAAALETMQGALTPQRGPQLTMSLHEPIG